MDYGAFLPAALIGIILGALFGSGVGIVSMLILYYVSISNE